MELRDFQMLPILHGTVIIIYKPIKILQFLPRGKIKKRSIVGVWQGSEYASGFDEIILSFI